MAATLPFLVVAALALTAPAINDSKKKKKIIMDPATAKDVVTTFNDALQEESPLLEKEVLTRLMLAKSGFLASPDSDTIKAIKELIEDKMLPKISASHLADQTQLDDLKGQLDQCKTTKDTSVVDANIQKGLYEAESPKHKACRVTENEYLLAKNTCNEELADKLQFKILKCDAWETLQTTLADVAANKAKQDTLVGESLDGYIKRVHDTQCSEGNYQKYVDAKAACDAAKQTWTVKTSTCANLDQQYTTKKQMCDSSQETMDNAACSHAEKVQDACKIYTECHANKKQAYDAAETTVKQNEKDRQTEWRATKRMLCLVKAFDDGNVKDSEVKACKDKTHDTSDLEINYPTAASVGPCLVPNLYPTTAAYKAAEFDGLPALAKGDQTANECVGIKAGATQAATTIAASCWRILNGEEIKNGGFCLDGIEFWEGKSCDGQKLSSSGQAFASDSLSGRNAGQAFDTDLNNGPWCPSNSGNHAAGTQYIGMTWSSAVSVGCVRIRGDPGHTPPGWYSNTVIVQSCSGGGAQAGTFTHTASVPGVQQWHEVPLQASTPAPAPPASIHNTMSFAPSNTAGGCSYDGQHAFKWENIGSMGWKQCASEASKRGAMMTPGAYSVEDGWYGHRIGDNAMWGKWSSYRQQNIGTPTNCVLGYAKGYTGHGSTTLPSKVSYGGLTWQYKDYGNIYFDQCIIFAAQAGAIIITPHTIGQQASGSYWVHSAHMCNTYEWITSAGTTFQYSSVGGQARSPTKNCMVGYVGEEAAR